MTAPVATSSSTVITPDQLLKHWQGHRRLTRRVIAAFPEVAFEQHTIGGMRTFAKQSKEIIEMAAPTLKGVISGQWEFAAKTDEWTRDQTLAQWDATTVEIDRLWPSIPAHRFQEVDMAFGQWEMSGYGILLYVIDNEIHHRAQGYVYLRSLGIEPPPFYER